MHVAIVSNPPDLSNYVAEMLRTWGFVCYELIEPQAPFDPSATPVVVSPASGSSQRSDEALIDYARRGGTVICFSPADRLAHAADLEPKGEREPPTRLRITAFPASGLAGEILPIAGPVTSYEHGTAAKPLAYLSRAGRYHGETVGISETEVGSGRIIAFAFDLPRCVLLLRQGDPSRAESVPAPDKTARPCHLACELGSHEAGWVPFADLLARLLVDLIRRYLPAPVPMISHLPDSAPGILLYSGDEDGAAVSANDDQLEWIAEAGGRMNLYLIPTRTHSTAPDVDRYRRRHDVGPHPILDEFYDRPVADRLAEFERQILMFKKMFGASARTMRNHSTAWAGYLELVQVMERLGVGMEGNYFSGAYMRDRHHAPYAAFGGAMPMRFCQPDGDLLDVYQQHTHMSDDVGFGQADYSYRLSPETYAVEVERIFTDISTRFHTPYAVCIHPGNWIRFSRHQGMELVWQASRFGMPTWSFDQWLEFCEARATWTVADLAWNGSDLIFSLRGERHHADLRIALPAAVGKAAITDLRLGEERVEWETVVRFRESVALAPMPAGRTEIAARAIYG